MHIHCLGVVIIGHFVVRLLIVLAGLLIEVLLQFQILADSFVKLASHLVYLLPIVGDLWDEVEGCGEHGKLDIVCSYCPHVVEILFEREDLLVVAHVCDEAFVLKLQELFLGKNGLLHGYIL